METELAARSVLDPGRLGKGRDETSELEESTPPAGSVKVLRQVPRRSLGAALLVSASSHRARRPPPKWMSLLNPWTWGKGVDCSTERVHWPTWSGEGENAKGESTGDGKRWNGPHSRVGRATQVRGRQRHRQDGRRGGSADTEQGRRVPGAGAGAGRTTVSTFTPTLKIERGGGA